MKRFLPIILFLLAMSPVFFAPSCANTTQAPTGGPKDTIPPVIVNIKPLPGRTGFPVSKGKIVFYFDEYVTIKNQTSIYLSPPQAKRPQAKIVGKTLVVTFEEDLEPETTYTLNLNDAIADNNEGNIFAGFTYVFSTGQKIDSMFVTGSVLDCNTLDPVKGATVMLYKDHSDSAVFLHRPYAAAKTDDWGYFVIPYIQDTSYRIYAVMDQSNDNIYNPDEDKIGFIDSVIVPKWHAADTIPELLKYDMKDTLGCRERRVEHEMVLFQERPTKQFLSNSGRPSDRQAFVAFRAQDAWIDSLWVAGYNANQIISQFNREQDSLLLWVNDRRIPPDTLHVFVAYRKTDSLGAMVPDLEHLRLASPTAGKIFARSSRRNLKHEDTTCVMKFAADPTTVEQVGFRLEFSLPIISQKFDSLDFRYLNPKQKEFKGELRIERDSLDLRCYNIFPTVKMQAGFEYRIKIPHRAFRDITGHYSDSTEVKVSLPTDEALSSLKAMVSGVHEKYIVELLGEKADKTLRRYVIEKDCNLFFPYLKEGKYCIRVTQDVNRNSMVDTGDLLARRQPELVKFVQFAGDKFLDIPKSSEVEQNINLAELFR